MGPEQNLAPFTATPTQGAGAAQIFRQPYMLKVTQSEGKTL